MQLNIPFVSYRTETLDFKDFLSSNTNKKRVPQCESPKKERNPLLVYSISPLAFMDLNFILIGSGVVLVAVIEKALADAGMLTIASVMAGIFRIGFSLAALGSIYYVIASSSFL